MVTAHPDDVDFGVAGTVARFTDCGIEVAYCIVTDGDAGGSDRSVTRAEVAAIRREEQTKAAAIVGVDTLWFLGQPDGRLEPTPALRADITRVIRRFRPDRVITQNPERNWSSLYSSHPDHMAVGQACLAAVYPDARNPFAFPELLQVEHLEPHSVNDVWVMGAAPNHWSDVTATVDRKIAALLAHESQHQSPEGVEARVRGWNASNAKAGGLADGRLAESFYRIDTR